MIVWKILPESLSNSGINFDSEIAIQLILDNVLNYNTFVFNCSVQLPTYLLLLLFFYMGQAKNHIDPQTLKPLETDSERNELVMANLFTMIAVLLGLLFGIYMRQLDLANQVIKTHLV